jgi:hypothetical protein
VTSANRIRASSPKAQRETSVTARVASPFPRLGKQPVADAASADAAEIHEDVTDTCSGRVADRESRRPSCSQRLRFSSSRLSADMVGRPKARITSGSWRPRSIAERSLSSGGRRVTTLSPSGGSGLASIGIPRDDPLNFLRGSTLQPRTTLVRREGATGVQPAQPIDTGLWSRRPRGATRLLLPEPRRSDPGAEREVGDG